MVKVRILPYQSHMFLMWRNIAGQAQTMFQMSQDDKIFQPKQRKQRNNSNNCPFPCALTEILLLQRVKQLLRVISEGNHHIECLDEGR